MKSDYNEICFVLEDFPFIIKWLGNPTESVYRAGELTLVVQGMLARPVREDDIRKASTSVVKQFQQERIFCIPGAT
jgi:hypothetical protein